MADTKLSRGFELSKSDREAVERLSFEPDSEPSFDVVKSCLIWNDEKPPGLSYEGQKLLGRLWAVRSLIHRHIPESQWPEGPRNFLPIWQELLRGGLKWTGFRRLTLSDRDGLCLKKCLRDSANDGGDYLTRESPRPGSLGRARPRLSSSFAPDRAPPFACGKGAPSPYSGPRAYARLCVASLPSAARGGVTRAREGAVRS
jgi:hypothetical protein